MIICPNFLTFVFIKLNINLIELLYDLDKITILKENNIIENTSKISLIKIILLNVKDIIEIIRLIIGNKWIK